jgi:hypothetical protein
VGAVLAGVLYPAVAGHADAVLQDPIPRLDGEGLAAGGD